MSEKVKMSVKCRKNLLLLLFIARTVFFGGCDDSGVAPPPPVYIDTNVIVYMNVSPFYWQFGSYDTTFAGVNILDGKSTRQDSVNKDIELTGSAGTFQNFYFRSGNLTYQMTGKKTRFKWEYSTMTPSQFDTLSVIKDTDTALTPSDFTQDSTSVWGFFNVGQNRFPVFSFYLEGRNTGNKFLYGVFHIKSVQRVFSVEYGTYGVMVTIDIKYNKAGKNQMREKIPL